MKSRFGIALILSLMLATSVATSFAQGKGKGHHKGDDDEQGEDKHGRKREAFRSHDRGIITVWFRDHRSGEGLPPGLAKRDRLPPGLEKQLRERGSLPPGLQKRFQPLPEDLERRLPPCPAGYQRGVIGAHVVLVNRSGSIVVDVIRNVF